MDRRGAKMYGDGPSPRAAEWQNLANMTADVASAHQPVYSRSRRDVTIT